MLVSYPWFLAPPEPRHQGLLSWPPNGDLLWADYQFVVVQRPLCLEKMELDEFVYFGVVFQAVLIDHPAGERSTERPYVRPFYSAIPCFVCYYN